MRVGIDAGGILIKIVMEDDTYRTLSIGLTTDINKVAQWLSQDESGKINLTGGDAGAITENIKQSSQIFVEFDAASRGLGILLKEQGHHINRYISTSIGTGTSLHYYNDHHQERVGGIDTGGGMIRGLGHLLTEISDYETFTDLAQFGNRDIIDLKVKHIYKDSEPPIPGELTAANFGSVLNNMNEHVTNSDKLVSVVDVVGEVITTMAITVAREYQTRSIVYTGPSFNNNPLLRKVIEDHTVLRGRHPFYIGNGAFSGAIDALHLS